MGLNDVAWESLFKKYDILEAVKIHGEFIISANQIKEFREPRLMTKFDHKINLPSVFADNNLAVLPISRGDYIISSFSAYKELESPGAEVRRVSIPPYIQSLMPHFLVFSNGVFNLYQYQFENPRNYNSLRLIKQKNYMISTQIGLSDIKSLLKTVVEVKEPDISFPQANSMARIINLIELLHEKPMMKQDITTKYAFDERQTNYYTDAGRYLGLIDKERDKENNPLFRLSDKGRYIMGLEYRERQLTIVAQILSHGVFREILKLYLQYGEMPDKNTVVRIMKSSNLYNIKSDSTFERRSSTVIGWINWIFGIIK